MDEVKAQEIRDRIEKIVWLASFPKSGNTWMRLFLQSYYTGMPPDINKACLFSHSDQANRIYQSVMHSPLSEATEPEIVFFRGAALAKVVQENQPSTFFLKTHHCNMMLEGQYLIPPLLTNCAIYLIRDPRDVALSYARHLSKPVDYVIDLMNTNTHVLLRDYNIKDFISTWSNHVLSWEQSKFKVILLRYEDLVNTPIETFTEVVNALGLEVVEEDLQNAVKWTTFHELRSKEDAHGFNEAKGGKFFGFGKVGRWKTELTAEQADKIVEHHGETMQRYGYET